MDRDAVDVLLAQWAREKPDLDTSPMGIVGRTFRAQSLLARAISPVFEERGLSVGEFDVLATLLRSGAPHRLAVGELQGFTMVTGGAITNRLDQLVRKGWVTRAPNPENRRTILVELTPGGKAVVEEVLLAHVANEHRLLAGLDAAEREQLNTLLRKLLVVLGDAPPRRAHTS